MATEVPVLIPHESVNDESVKLLRWLVDDGQWVDANQAVAEVEGSKATFDVTTSHAGTIYLRAVIGEEVPVGAPLCHVRVVATPEVVHPQANNGTSTSPRNSLPTAKSEWEPRSPTIERENSALPFTPRFSTAALELIERHNLPAEQFHDLRLVRTSDVRKRIDLQPNLTTERETNPNMVTARTDSPVSAKSNAKLPESVTVTPVEAADRQTESHVDEVALSRQKLTEIRYLRQGADTVLPSQVSVLVPTSGLREALLRDSAALSLTGLVIFEVARLIRRYPQFNAFYTERSARYYRGVNVGFAVAGEYGLKVLVIHEADEKSVGRIAEEVRELLAAYATDSLAPHQLAGGTFTVSDLSGEGVFSAYSPHRARQSAILGVGGETRLADDAGGFFSLTLSFDHQLTDGLQAARFLSDLGTRLHHHENTLRQRVAPPTCSRCNRTVPELNRLNAHLLQTIAETGCVVRVCSYCIAGF